MEKDHFRWWYKRMEANAKLYDVIRIDHFIGIVNFWSIPASCPTAVADTKDRLAGAEDSGVCI